MQTVNISELRANLLQYLEKANQGEQISITSNGRLLATISPPVDRKVVARRQLKELAASAKLNDVITPTGSDWDAIA